MLSAGGPVAAAPRGAALGGGRTLPLPLHPVGPAPTVTVPGAARSALPVTASHGDSGADAAPVRLGLGLRVGLRSCGMGGPSWPRGGVVAAAARGSASASSARSRSRGRSQKDGGGGAGGGDGGDGVGGNGGSTEHDSAEPGGEGEGGGGGSVEDRELYDEAYDSYMGYALSVIVSRALPDARDGLKPVHRRILYAMHELGLTHTKPYKKCARVVGEVLGKFHPHGDTAVYDALVRMAQPFSMAMPLIQGHGNFGSQDADPAAAMRYTECRLAPLATDALLADLGGTWPRRGSTVDWINTFDESQEEPSVLPAAVPLLLVNGSSGIAVGLASSIPPHNMAEVVAALRHLIHHPEASTEELMAFVQGPDFPTGGELVVGPELLQAYASGRGQVTLRAKAAVERRVGKGGDRERIVITELPYQVPKADLISTIAGLVTDKERCRELGLEGVADVRDESDRRGLKVVVELRKGAAAEDTLARLLKHTRLQVRVSFNCVAMVGAMPQHMGLRAMLQTFLDFRCEVVRRRSEAALSAAQSRLHLVEGFLGLLQDPGRMDAVVAEVRGAPDGAAAKAALVERHGLSLEQAGAVLSLTLGRLTHLEASKLAREAEQLAVSISGHQAVLTDRAELLRVVEEAAAALVQDYPTPRRTAVLRADEGSSPSASELPPAALAPNRPCLLLATSSGFLRRLPEDGVRAQNRATKGKTGIKVRGDAGLAGLVACRERDPLLLLTPGGHAYETRAADVQAQVSSTSTGSSIAQVLKLEESVPISAMLPLPPRAQQQQLQHGDREEEEEEGGGHEDGPSIVLCSTAGYIKRIRVPATRINKKGIKVMDLDPKTAAAGSSQPQSEAGPGSLGWAALAGCGGDVVVLASRQGQLLALRAGDVRVQGRAAKGVKAMALGGKRRPGDAIADVAVVPRRLAHLLPARGAGEADREEQEEQHGAEEGQEQEGAAAEPAGPCLLLISEAGYGKRVRLAEVCLARRAQAGQRGAALRPGDRLVGCLVVEAGDEVVLASTRGAVVRMAADAVSLQGRGARGVKLMGLEPGDSVADVVLAPRGAEGGEEEEEEEEAKGRGKRDAAARPKGKGKKGVADAA